MQGPALAGSVNGVELLQELQPQFVPSPATCQVFVDGVINLSQPAGRTHKCSAVETEPVTQPHLVNGTKLRRAFLKWLSRMRCADQLLAAPWQ